jgi:hypothetical protein
MYMNVPTTSRHHDTGDVSYPLNEELVQVLMACIRTTHRFFLPHGYSMFVSLGLHSRVVGGLCR